MEAKHTKGTWFYSSQGWGSGMEIFSKNEGGEVVARIVDCESGLQTPMLSHEESEANAKLIAAAPDLLEAMVEIRAWYEKNFEELLDRRTPISFSKGLSAIHKATK